MERYSHCYLCKGNGWYWNMIEKKRSECGSCGGTGFSGDAMDFIEMDLRSENEQRMNAALDALNRYRSKG